MIRRSAHSTLFTLILALQLILQPLAQAAPCSIGSTVGDSCCCDDESAEATESLPTTCCSEPEAPEPRPSDEQLDRGDCGCVATPEWVSAIPAKTTDEADTCQQAATLAEPPTTVRPWSGTRPTIRAARARPGVPRPLHLIFQVFRL